MFPYAQEWQLIAPRSENNSDEDEEKRTIQKLHLIDEERIFSGQQVFYSLGSYRSWHSKNAIESQESLLFAESIPLMNLA